MKQNIYDNEVFYTSYINLRKTSTGLNDVLEIPAFRSMLPDLRNLHILDLGCGFGENCNWYAQQRAAFVTGIDISQKMIAKAESLYPRRNIKYMNLPVEDIDFNDQEFDLVVSSLAFHYVKDLKAVLKKIYCCLKPNGCLVFSQEHPVATAKKLSKGWLLDQQGNKLHWILDNYGEEGIRKQSWFIDGVIKYHRTLSTMINDLIETGFKIEKVLEPTATLEAEERDSRLKDERRRPPFIIFKVSK